MMVATQHCIILNPFIRQSTKPIQDSILCVSNLHMYIISNFNASIQAFLCRAKPDPRVFHLYITFFLCLQLETNRLVYCLQKQNVVFCLWSRFFFFWGGGEGEIKDTLQWIPRVLLSGKILGLFSSAEFSQWILAVPTVHFLYQIMNNCRASDCFTKNNEKSLTYLCSG